MNVLDIFSVVNFLKIYSVLESTEIMIESNLWVRMHMPYILKGKFKFSIQIETQILN